MNRSKEREEIKELEEREELQALNLRELMELKGNTTVMAGIERANGTG